MQDPYYLLFIFIFFYFLPMELFCCEFGVSCRRFEYSLSQCCVDIFTFCLGYIFVSVHFYFYFLQRILNNNIIVFTAELLLWIRLWLQSWMNKSSLDVF